MKRTDALALFSLVLVFLGVAFCAHPDKKIAAMFSAFAIALGFISGIAALTRPQAKRNTFNAR